jgi:predicted anti-sigma-YlaC factor YlaD
LNELRHLRSAALAALLALVAGGCSIERYATGKVADALAATGGTFASDEDVQLVRDASPFGLKLMENVLESQPEHQELLTALARGFTQYAFAFVAQDGDRAEVESLERAEALRQRARRLYLRARGYGLRALEVACPRFRAELERDPRAATARLRRSEIEPLYWTAAAWGASLALSKDRPESVAEQPALEALLDRALALDESYGAGALRALLIAYEPARIGQARGAAERSRAHVARAVELSGGLSAGPYVALAESVAVAGQDRAEFLRLLGAALAVDPDAAPERRVENLVQQDRARWLLARVDELFLE